MKAYIAFGSNWGDRLGNILKAVELLKDVGYVEKVSTVYESLAWGVENQPPFLNGVLELKTDLDPIGLLKHLKDIEFKVGRKKRERWGPREIDLDIVLYEDYIVMLSFLRIPHPYLEERDFVLVPLSELEKTLVHPITKKPLTFKGKPTNLKPFACILT